MADYLRLVDRTALQTPVHRYTHPDSGRAITVVCLQHAGPPAYFAALRAIIDDLHTGGAEVHVEGARLVPIDAAPSDEEQFLLDQLERCNRLEQRRLAEVGWVDQLEGLGYPPHWRNVDISALEIIRLAGPEPVWQLVRKRFRMLDWPEGDRRGLARYRLKVNLMMRVVASGVMDRRRPAPEHAVLLELRNRRALKEMFETDRDVVAVWGALHLPGLAAGLRAQRFAHTDTTWISVAQLPKVRSLVWNLIRGSAARTRTA